MLVNRITGLVVLERFHSFGWRVNPALSKRQACVGQALLLAWRAKSINFAVTDANARGISQGPHSDPSLLQSPGVPEEFLGAFDDEHGFVIDAVWFINP